MAIVTMKKLTLLAMQADKESIFDALVRTRSVELKRSENIESCVNYDVTAERERLIEKIARVENAITYVSKRAKGVEKVELPKGSFARPLPEIGCDYFLSFGSNAERMDMSIDSIAALRDTLANNTAEIAARQAEIARLSLIRNVPHPTSWYKDTDSSVVSLMQCNASELNNVKAEFLERAPAFGLVKCSVTCDVLPQAAIENIDRQLLGLKEQREVYVKQIVAYAPLITEFKVYVDYLSLCDKKLSADGDLQNTNKTFVLEAYYPASDEDKVTNAIQNVSDCIVLKYDDIGEDEFAPTLIQNNKITTQFEFVTNMYTPPTYHEIDPNPVMSVFYFAIFGLMVADIGYGLLLVLAGLFAFFAIKQTSGLKTMLQLFGICGVAAIIVGALFGSFFSYPIYDKLGVTPPIPAPDKYPMVMMMLSLLVGIVHICAGIGCNMAVKIKRKQHASAWLADFPWIIVFVTFVLAIFNSALDMAAYEPYNALKLPDIVSKVSLYVCLGALAIALIFAGLGTKGFLGKVMKSFGSAYGIINYFSDIMSYIRVFGLMLSSALMGTVINQLGEMVWSGGGVGYVLAIVLLIFAHIFNLVMGILGVYIHNGRLQYVEFFGKFYTGDGHLFTPFGSDTKYTLVKDKK